MWPIADSSTVFLNPLRAAGQPRWVYSIKVSSPLLLLLLLLLFSLLLLLILLLLILLLLVLLLILLLLLLLLLLLCRELGKSDGAACLTQQRSTAAAAAAGMRQVQDDAAIKPDKLGPFGRAQTAAVGETVILLTPPVLSRLKHLTKATGVPSNDSLADG